MKVVMISVLMLTSVIVTVGQQRIRYTDIEKEDSRNMNFDIVGKVGDKLIVYKNKLTDNFLTTYDADMRLVNRTKLTNMPGRIINADFVAYANHFYMIYQYQKKNIIYCEAIKFNSEAKKMDETIVLDTTSIPMFQNDNKIYSVQVSDNKQKIAIIKANKRNEKNHIIGIVMYNAAMEKAYKRFYNINMDGRNNFLDEFVVDNDGDVFAAKCYSSSGNEFVTKIEMQVMPFDTDALKTYPINTDDKTLDEIIYKVDNSNKRIIIQSFFYTKRRGNIDGMYVGFFDKTTNTVSKSNFTKFADSIRIDAKGINNLKMAFNDYFIRQVFPKKTGGFIVAAESYYTTTRGNNMWNRWDFFGASPYITSYDYYNMGLRDWYWNSWDRGANGISYNAENVVIMSFDATGSMEWHNAVHKSQRDDGSEYYVSYGVMLTGGQLHFLYNEKDRNSNLMFDNSVSPDGQLTRHPTLKGLNRQYNLMPRFAKQISAKEMIIPCEYKNYICFAKLEY